MAPERRNEKENPYVAQDRAFKRRDQQNQEFTPDQAAEVAETKE